MTDKEQQSETGVIRVDGAESFVEYSVELLKPAIRTINIITSDMDELWLGDAKVVEQIKQSVLKNRRVHIKLLVADPIQAIRTNHPLIPLIRRLTRIEAKVINEEFLDKQPLKHSMILVDRGGIIVKQSVTDYSGFVHFDDKQTVRTQTALFEQYWRYSHSHSDLQHVYL